MFSVSLTFSLQALRTRSLALALKGVLVKQVLRHLVVLGVHAGEVGNVVTQLLDGLHLLVQVVSLQEVTKLRIGGESVNYT